MEVVIFIGLQASGKSTFYRTHFASTHVLVSVDLLRNKHRPRRTQMRLIGESLKEGRSVVVDNTNPAVEGRAEIIGLAKTHGATVIGCYFDSPFADCLARNNGRSGTARVPDVAIQIAQQRMRPPTIRGGVRSTSAGQPVGRRREVRGSSSVAKKVRARISDFASRRPSAVVREFPGHGSFNPPTSASRRHQ